MNQPPDPSGSRLKLAGPARPFIRICPSQATPAETETYVTQPMPEGSVRDPDPPAGIPCTRPTIRLWWPERRERPAPVAGALP